MTATTGSGDTPRDDRETGAQDAPYGHPGGAADGPDDQNTTVVSGSSPVTPSADVSAPQDDPHASGTGEPYAESSSAPTPSFAAGPAPVENSGEFGSHRPGGPAADAGDAADTSSATATYPAYPTSTAYPAGEGARHPSPYGPPPTSFDSGAGSAGSPGAGGSSPAGRTDAVPDPAGTADEPTLYSSGYPSSADTTETSRYPAVSVPPMPRGSSDQDQDRTVSTATGQEPTTTFPGPADYAPSVPGHSPLVPAAAEPMVVPAPEGAVALQTGTGRDPGGRAIAAVISTVLGALLVAGGLYLVGEFGSRLATTMLDTGTTGSVRDIILTLGGAVLILVAVILNGWSPWATLLPGIALTGAGVWSVVSYDGADRIAGFVDLFFDSGQLVNWGVTGWILIIGVALLGASIAAIIARAAGRTRGRP